MHVVHMHSATTSYERFDLYSHPRQPLTFNHIHVLGNVVLQVGLDNCPYGLFLNIVETEHRIRLECDFLLHWVYRLGGKALRPGSLAFRGEEQKCFVGSSVEFKRSFANDLCARFSVRREIILGTACQRAHSKKPGRESHRSSKRKTARLHTKSGRQVLGQFFYPM